MVFWHTLESHIIQCLDILDSQSLPLATHYSSFRLHTLPTSMPSSAPKVDDPELQNKARLLERLEISPEVAEETMNEERDSSASVPGINEPSHGLTPNAPTPSAISVPMMDVTLESDMEEGTLCPSLPANWQQEEMRIADEFWNHNPRPSDLPPIRMILDAINTPAQSIGQQNPRIIWEEIMKLHMPQHTEKVVCLFAVTFECC